MLRRTKLLVGKGLIGLAAVFLLTACGGPHTLRLPRGAVGYALTFAPSGDALMVLHNVEQGNDIAECRDFPGGRTRWRVEGAGGLLMSTAFSPDGSEVALYDGDRLRFYDAQDGTLRHEIELEVSEGPGEPLDIAVRIEAP